MIISQVEWSIDIRQKLLQWANLRTIIFEYLFTIRKGKTNTSNILPLVDKCVTIVADGISAR